MKEFFPSYLNNVFSAVSLERHFTVFDKIKRNHCNFCCFCYPSKDIKHLKQNHKKLQKNLQKEKEKVDNAIFCHKENVD